MTKRDFWIGAICGIIGLFIGIAVCPRQTGTAMDSFPNYVSGFYIADGRATTKHAFTGPVGHSMSQSVLMEKRGVSHVVGVEFYISEYLYKDLTESEKDGWHPVHYSVRSGHLYCPDVTRPWEADKFYDRLDRMYVKTVIVWQPGQKLPGTPFLARPAVKDGEVDEATIRTRDNDLIINTADLATYRQKKFPDPTKKGQATNPLTRSGMR